MFIMVMSTTWWGSSLKLPEEQLAFEEAVDNLHWVLEQLFKLHSTLDNSDLSPPPAVPSTPIRTANYLAHPAGKCQPKPSYKLVEGS